MPMHKLRIHTPLDEVVVCGEFCDWNFAGARRVKRKTGSKAITVEIMPKGEYRVFSCANFLSGEGYPTDGRQMENRYFSGVADETIYCYFSKE